MEAPELVSILYAHELWKFARVSDMLNNVYCYLLFSENNSRLLIG